MFVITPIPHLGRSRWKWGWFSLFHRQIRHVAGLSDQRWRQPLDPLDTDSCCIWFTPKSQPKSLQGTTMAWRTWSCPWRKYGTLRFLQGSHAVELPGFSFTGVSASLANVSFLMNMNDEDPSYNTYNERIWLIRTVQYHEFFLPSGLAVFMF